MQISQDRDTATGRVPCPGSWSPVDPSNIPLACPNCGRHVSVEPDPFGVLAVYEHTTSRPDLVVAHRIAVELRQIIAGQPVSAEPDEIDMAHARRLLDVLTGDPSTLQRLWAQTMRLPQAHAFTCTDRDYCHGECLAGIEPL